MLLQKKLPHIIKSVCVRCTGISRHLTEQGIPLSFEAGKGYFVVQGYFLPPVSFNNEEANALMLMEHLIPGFADQSIQKHYTSALNKVKAVLKTPQKEKLELLNESIRLQLPECIKNDFQHLSVLQQLISSRSLCKITYVKNNNESSERNIEAIGLIFYAFNWHLIAWCHQRQEYRDFRVSRITDIKCLDEPFQKTDHISVGDYMQCCL